VGGRRDPSRYLYRFDNQEYCSPNFTRWAGVDFDMLRREIASAKELHHSAREQWSHLMSQLPGRPVYNGGVCAVELPSSWDAYYQHNALNLCHLVLGNLSSVNDIEYNNYKFSCSNVQAAAVDQQSIPRGSKVDPNSPKPWNLLNLVPPPSDGDRWFIFLRESTLVQMVDSFEKRYRSDYLMRMDQLKLHVSPLEWDQTKKAILDQAETLPTSDPRNKARFSMSIDILYELAPDYFRCVPGGGEC